MKEAWQTVWPPRPAEARAHTSRPGGDSDADVPTSTRGRAAIPQGMGWKSGSCRTERAFSPKSVTVAEGRGEIRVRVPPFRRKPGRAFRPPLPTARTIRINNDFPQKPGSSMRKMPVSSLLQVFHQVSDCARFDFTAGLKVFRKKSPRMGSARMSSSIFFCRSSKDRPAYLFSHARWHSSFILMQSKVLVFIAHHCFG